MSNVLKLYEGSFTYIIYNNIVEIYYMWKLYRIIITYCSLRISMFIIIRYKTKIQNVRLQR